MPPLGAVESHRFVEYGEQSGIVFGVFRIAHGLFQVGCGLAGRGMAGEYRIQPLQESVGIKSGHAVGIVRIGLCGVGIIGLLIELCGELCQQRFLVDHRPSLIVPYRMRCASPLSV